MTETMKKYTLQILKIFAILNMFQSSLKLSSIKGEIKNIRIFKMPEEINVPFKRFDKNGIKILQRRLADCKIFKFEKHKNR